MIIKTSWNNLSSPYICGLLASNPSQYSATLHNAGYKALDINFSYHAFKVQDLNLPIEAMIGMGFRGYSVTIPFKEEALKFVDQVDNTCAKIGALNTIINDGKQLFGLNTDWIGIKNSLLEIGSEFKGKRALILGAGGAAKAAIYALEQLKFNSITVCNRTPKRAKEVAHEFKVEQIETTKLANTKLSSFDVLINSTPLLAMDFFPYQYIHKDHIVFEMITQKTKLTETAEKAGAKVIHGIKMLLHQGIEQFKLFTEKKPPHQEIEKALLSFYNNK